ncbi:tungsten-containing aldehyde ferredoxin oxidoreductase [Desulforapulum autotrophicum HRM2]|uniref:Tungsten-containing aldehyde ferredoxin oxidoreductase n=1 Tax=Desulforapulum autotrophicum (strain ATCC 43914 / DSM 3382 / VKM B-1955 / HRM2) TaxID=177437 RepID=C0QEW3_DESAH|nr:aldehyde ferredoxin oxidoreductase family protein [Desulforapulum autotrophicum]ACN17464.1 tungsten-containing aldehyde ferredoxin oxidoreductase [Desulforapulum autotrophicum HRM2]
MMNHLGSIVHVDLSEKKVTIEPFGEKLARTVLGGFGFNTWYLYKNLPKNALALGPENILIISCGLLTGTAAPASSRSHVSAKSPLSGLMGSSSVGGHIGARLKSLGIAAMVIRGRSDLPVSLVVDKTGVSFRTGEDLWGLSTRNTESVLRNERQGQNVEILSIGVAGENLVPFACIMNGTDHAAGRTGMGAVMGSKNLKAILVAGVKNLEKSSPETKALVKAYIGKIKAGLPIYTDFSTTGSSAHIQWLNDTGQLGTRNYQEGTMDGVEKIDGKNLLTYVEKKTSCHRCPVHCKAEIKIKAGRHQGFHGGRPEYETVINMGSLCGLKDPDELLYLSNLANILGIDTISTGSIIAFAMELYERGIITTQDTGGLALTWGNAQAMEALMHQIALRKGFGKILSLGVKGAASVIGKGSEQYAYHTKGVEIYGSDPRGSQAIALSYTVSLRGGDFTSVYPIPAFRYTQEKAQKEFGTTAIMEPHIIDGKGILVRGCLLTSAIIDSLGLCKVPTLSIMADFTLENESDLIRAITGLELSAQELFYRGEQLINMEKLFNLAHGASLENDNLPGLFQEKGLPHGPVKGLLVEDLSVMVQDFYTVMGWDEAGIPTGETLKRLKLEEI